MVQQVPATTEENSRPKTEEGTRQRTQYQVTFEGGNKVLFSNNPATIMCKKGKDCPFHKRGTCVFKHPETVEQEEKVNPQGEGTAFTRECGVRPDPPLSIGDCQQKGLCITWMRTGACIAENCPYKHSMPPETFVKNMHQ